MSSSTNFTRSLFFKTKVDQNRKKTSSLPDATNHNVHFSHLYIHFFDKIKSNSIVINHSNEQLFIKNYFNHKIDKMLSNMTSLKLVITFPIISLKIR